MKGTTYTVPEDYVAVLPKTLVSSGNNVILKSPTEIIDESSNTAWIGNIRKRELFSRKQKWIPGYSTLLRAPFHNYYHFLIDEFPRLLAIEGSPLKELDEIKLLSSQAPSKTEQFFLSRLELENLQMSPIQPNKLYRAENLVFTPFKTQRFCGYMPAKYVNVLQSKFCPKRPSKRSRRVLISRERALMRKIDNRSELVESLAPLGFSEIILEDLSPQEQIELFYDAEVVVGAHGAGMTNMLFSPHLKVLELFPTWYIVPHFYYMCKSMGHDHAYLCGSGDDPKPSHFRVDVAAVNRILEGLLA